MRGKEGCPACAERETIRTLVLAIPLLHKLREAAENPLKVCVLYSGEEDGELITPNAGDNIRFAKDLLDYSAELPNRPVSFFVTKLVVDPLEIVKVKKEYSRFLPLSLCSKQCMLGKHQKPATVVDPGELVSQ